MFDQKGPRYVLVNPDSPIADESVRRRTRGRDKARR